MKTVWQKELRLPPSPWSCLLRPFLLSQEPASAIPSKPSKNVKPAMEWKRFDYTCEAGAKLTVYLHNETVKVRFKDNTYLMRQVPSADGGKLFRWKSGVVERGQRRLPARRFAGWQRSDDGQGL